MNIFLKSKVTEKECISRSVSLGDFIYVSGQVGQGADIQSASMDACQKLLDALKDSDALAHHVVKTTVYLKNVADQEAFLAVYKNFFEAPYPAASIVGVADLPDGGLVSIEALAINTTQYEQQVKQSSGCGCSDGCDGCDCGC